LATILAVELADRATDSKQPPAPRQGLWRTRAEERQGRASADPAFKRDRPSCSSGMDVPAPADREGRLESRVILHLESMLSKPQRNPKKGEEVKTAISSHVFVVFAQTFSLQGLLREKEEVRECTCAKAHLQSLLPSL